jgi:hypothetical protein
MAKYQVRRRTASSVPSQRSLSAPSSLTASERKLQRLWVLGEAPPKTCLAGFSRPREPRPQAAPERSRPSAPTHASA